MSGPTLGVALEGREPASTIADLARIAEAGGAGTLWVANHLFQRDPVVQGTMALAATTRIRVALMAMSPYSTHPVQIAMAAASMNEHFPGRVMLSLGAGAPGDFAAAGIDRVAPVATMRESLDICRKLLGGGFADHEGARFSFKGRPLNTGAQDVPIVIAATRPRMLALAGDAADGVLLSAGTSVDFVRHCLGQVGDRPVRRIGLVFASVDDDRRRAYDRLRTMLGFVLRGAHHRPNLEMSGARLDQRGVNEALARDDWAAAASFVGDDVVERHAVAGTPDEVRARLAAYHDAGLDELVLAGVDGPDQLRDLLAAAQRTPA